MNKKILLLTLQTFSTTGGIQKMTRTLAYSLFNIAHQTKNDFKLASIYDSTGDLMKEYLPADDFIALGGDKLKQGLKLLAECSKADLVILSHINLGLIGLLVKTINPKCKVWLIAHGIEVWRPATALQKKFLNRACDKVVAVSNFTKEQMTHWHQTDPNTCVVLNNAIDPFIEATQTFSKPEYLLKRYNLKSTDKIMFALTRLSATELYKGYDVVIKTVSRLKESFPNIKYLLAGKYDDAEGTRVKNLIKEYKVENEVILTGFVSEKELSGHFLLADLFVLPSRKEGFGIVFVEALIHGLPVICGNADGSLDAIANGELGTAINPDDTRELESAIIKDLSQPLTVERRELLQKKSIAYFGENTYRQRLEKLIKEDIAA
jgi:glycosyltransferase involved in cell wall biosynthesis